MQENADAGIVSRTPNDGWKFLLGLLAGGLLFALDLLTKHLFFARPALISWDFGGGFFRFADHRNFGITFDLPLPQWMIVSVTAILLALVTIGLWRARQSGRWQEATALALVFGGAVGNLLDRLRFGYVRDWMLFFNRSAINLADLAIIIGLIWYFFLHARPDKPPTAPSTS